MSAAVSIVRSGNLLLILDERDRFVGIATCVVVEHRTGASVSILYAGTNGPVRSYSQR